MKSTPNWCERSENRLIEMFRRGNTMEEIARELSMPMDMIETHLSSLRMVDQEHEEYEPPRWY